MKKPSSKVAHNSYSFIFSLTALSCPYGQKMKLHIGIWAETPSVISTLLFVLMGYLILTTSPYFILTWITLVDIRWSLFMNGLDIKWSFHLDMWGLVMQWWNLNCSLDIRCSLDIKFSLDIKWLLDIKWSLEIKCLLDTSQIFCIWKLESINGSLNIKDSLSEAIGVLFL